MLGLFGKIGIQYVKFISIELVIYNLIFFFLVISALNMDLH